jgi:hypothetical protein
MHASGRLSAAAVRASVSREATYARNNSWFLGVMRKRSCLG